MTKSKIEIELETVKQNLRRLERRHRELNWFVITFVFVMAFIEFLTAGL
jgi:hypothetical protein